jgi:hypothetical protein
LTGIADAADWTYWSHLESLFKSLPSGTKTVNEDEEEGDSSDLFLKELEPGCGNAFHLVLTVTQINGISFLKTPCHHLTHCVAMPGKNCDR